MASSTQSTKGQSATGSRNRDVQGKSGGTKGNGKPSGGGNGKGTATMAAPSKLPVKIRQTKLLIDGKIGRASCRERV